MHTNSILERKIFLDDPFKMFGGTGDDHELQLTVNRNESLHYVLVLLGAQNFTKKINITLAAPGSEVEIYVCCFGTEKANFNLKMHVVHGAPNTRVATYMRGVQRDASTVNFEGLITIPNASGGCDAYLEGHALLMGKKAKARIVPSLEIDTNDVVSAKHTAHVGPLDEDELFYLQTRGLSRKEAAELAVRAFFMPFIAHLPGETFQKQLLKKVVSLI